MTSSIALLGSYPASGVSLGGAATYAEALVAALESAGQSIVVLAQRRPAPKGGKAIPAWEPGWKLAKSVRQTLQRNRVDLVHFQYEPFLFGAGVGVLMALDLPRVIRGIGPACLMTLHAVPFPSMLLDRSSRTVMIRSLSAPYLRALHRARRWVETFVVHESDQAQTLVRFAKIPERQIAIIPHGVADLGSGLAVEGTRPLTVGTFGYLTPYKDPEYLLSEFGRLRKEKPEARLLFSVSRHPRRGNGRRLARILRHATEAPGVEVVGHIPNETLPEFLARCDVVAAPYRYVVSASGVVAAAIGAGVPVLVPTGSGNISQLDGWSFGPGPGMLASALARLSEHLPEMRARARSLAADRSWSRVAALHKALYAQA